MNEKFFALPKQKQDAIINAGYRVFSQNSYKKSPMSEIAGEAGISKSLLFHYFHNKQELYLFLWDNCAKLTIKYLTEYKCYEQTDLFEMMYREMYLASEGYLWEMQRKGTVNVEKMEKDFTEMLNFWKKLYLRKEEEK